MIQDWKYWNANYYSTAIVAVVTPQVDWAAYIGGADYRLPEKEAVEYVSRTGCKLGKETAKHFFPNILLPYRY